MKWSLAFGGVTCVTGFALFLSGCPEPEGAPLGTNLDAVTDWSTEWPFCDAFKTSRPWISGSDTAWDDGRPLDLDEHGWVRSLLPGQIARTLMFQQAPRYPSGEYHVLYEGQGSISYEFAARAKEELSTPGHDVVEVNTALGGGISLNIRETDPADYIRNIRVIMPGGVLADDPFAYVANPDVLPPGRALPLWQVCETQLFHPLFLERVRMYSTLRFMDWMMTNFSPVMNWADRARPEDARWSQENGVPVEVMCALANKLSAAPWFTLPHLATDDYVENFATVVRDTLNPGLKAYIEYSNEMWNGGFGQAQYAQEQGLALGLSTNAFEAGMRYYSQRSVEIFTIFETVFGGTSRLVRVLGSQAANTGVSPMVLAWNDAYLQTDALAIAPYFGYELGLPGNVDRVKAMSLSELFDELESVSLPQTYHWMEAQAAVAAEYGVTLVAYEGGQHLVGVGDVRENETINALFDAANRDPRMGTLYSAYLNQWRTWTGGIFCHFTHCGSYSKWGRWGSLEYMTQPTADAPKYKALQAFIDPAQHVAIAGS